MNVAFCTLPLNSGHKFRGVGYYTKNLLENLKSRVDLEITEFNHLKEVRDVDVVHFPWFDLYFKLLPLYNRFPTIITVHDVIPLIFPREHPVGFRRKINFALQKLALKKARYIVTDSYTSKDDIVKYLKISEESIVVIQLAASSEFKVLLNAKNLKVKRKFKLPDRFIMYVGDANYTKNLPFLIEGFKKVKERQEFKNLKLLLVGGVFLKKIEYLNHPELQSLKLTLEKIANLQLTGDVIKPGYVDIEDLVSFYNLATVYVQPSLYEGFGLPILEAMNCGTPVLSSNASSLKEVGGNAAIFFDPRNKSQFVELLTEILQSRSLQDKLSKLGLNQAVRFSWEETTNKYVEVYQKAATR